MVTNRHVVADAEEGSLVFMQNDGSGRPSIGQGVQVPILQFKDHWHGHPDPDVDIAVMPLQPLMNHREEPDWPTFGELTFVTPVRSQHVATSESIDDLDAMEEVFFIGYPDGLYDTHNLTPVVRRGITATPVQLDYEGQPTFLVDAAVFPDSSGSPVFAASTAWRVDEGGNLVFTHSRAMFLGVISHFYHTEDGRYAMDLGMVYKASTVAEAIEDWLRQYGRSA